MRPSNQNRDRKGLGDEAKSSSRKPFLSMYKMEGMEEGMAGMGRRPEWDLGYEGE